MGYDNPYLIKKKLQAFIPKNTHLIILVQYCP